MDRQTLLVMLQSIRKNNMLGPKTGDFEIGIRIQFAIDKGLIKRSKDGNFLITEKGTDLLDGKLNWEDV